MFLRAVLLSIFLQTAVWAVTYTVSIPNDTFSSTGGATTDATHGDLRFVLNQIQGAQALAAGGGGGTTYDIVFSGVTTVNLSKPLPVINLLMPSGTPDTVNINVGGSTVTIDGQSTTRIFYVSKGNLHLDHLTLQNGLAQGGTGGQGINAGTGGGGGMGAGGALFVDSATVTLDTVSFLSNGATGGSGGASGNPGFSNGGGGGGGGLGGNGGSGGGYSGTGAGGGGGGYSGTGGAGGSASSRGAGGGGGGAMGNGGAGSDGGSTPGGPPGGGGGGGSVIGATGGGINGGSTPTPNPGPGDPGKFITAGMNANLNVRFGGGGAGGNVLIEQVTTPTTTTIIVDNPGGNGGGSINFGLGGAGGTPGEEQSGGGGGGAGTAATPGSAGAAGDSTAFGGNGGLGGGGGGGGNGVTNPGGNGGDGGIGGGGGGGGTNVGTLIGLMGGNGNYGGGGGGGAGNSSFFPGSTAGLGGTGGFGGGGGGSSPVGLSNPAASGGFGGGGGGAGGGLATLSPNGGNGGFGAGGGGGGQNAIGGIGGAGAGSGGNASGGNPGGGGGGAALGGAIFLRAGTINFSSSPLAIPAGTLTAGSGGTSSSGPAGNAGGTAGTSIFLVTGSTMNFSPPTGQTITISGSIADDSSTSLPGGPYQPGTGTGASIQKQGLGSVNLTGTNTYKGGATVTGGTLFINGSVASGVTVQNTGTLGGTGTVLGTVNIQTGGTMSPGNSIGTMTVTDYVQDSGGTLFAEVSPPNSADLIIATNTATLAGNLTVDFLAGAYLPTDSFTILQAGTLNNSTFSSVTFQNTPAPLTPFVHYTFGPNGTVIVNFIAPPSPSPTPSITLPSTYAGGFIQTVLSDINHINSHITVRMQDLRRRFRSLPNNEIASPLVVSANDRYFALNPETEEKQEQLRREVVEPENTKPWSFYFGPLGRAFGEIHGKNDQPGADFWSVGGLIGIDYASSQVGVGFMGNYEKIYSHVKEHWGKIDVDDFQASIYLTYAPECLSDLAINAIGGGTYELYSIRRNTGGSVAKGKPHGFGYDGLFGIEYSVGNGCFHFIPLVNAQYIYLRVDGYNEHGAGSSDIHVQSQKVKSLRSSLGFRMNYYLRKCNFTFIPEIYGEWQREYLNKHRNVGIEGVASVFPGETLLVPGTGRNIALAGIDLLFSMHDRVGVEISYETEYNSLYHDHFFYLGVDFRF